MNYSAPRRARQRALVLSRTLLALLVLCVAVPASAAAQNYVLEDWNGSAPVGSWKSNGALDFNGWSTSTTDAQTFELSQNPTYWEGRGLYAKSSLTLLGGSGTAEWRFQAPGTSTIYRAEYAQPTFNLLGCLNEGLRTSAGAWQATINNRVGQSANASYHPTACGAGVLLPPLASAQVIVGSPGAQVFCSNTAIPCDRTASPTGNQAVFGIQRLGLVQPWFGAYLPGARLYETDYDRPTFTGATNDHTTWVRRAIGTITATSTDTGLGVKTTALSLPSVAGGTTTQTQSLTCSGNRNDRCAASWNGARPRYTPSYTYDTDNLPEGVDSFGLKATDIVENQSLPTTGHDTSLVPPAKVDRSDPTGITGSGQVPALDGKWFLGADTRTIDVAAHDTFSGVQSVQIETTSGRVLDAATFSCAGDQCPRDITKTLSVDTSQLPEGDTAVRLRATDLVGNSAVGRTWTLRIDRSDPTAVAGTGSLPDVSGTWTRGDDTRAVVATANDRYSGIQQLALETTDGRVLDQRTFPCDAGQCGTAEAATLSVDVATLPEGVTSVRLRAKDLLGHVTRGPQWDLRIDRSDPTGTTASGTLSSVAGGVVNGHTDLQIDVTADDAYSGVQTVDLTDGDGTVVATTSVCSAECPRHATGMLGFSTVVLGEGAHTLSFRATDHVGHIAVGGSFTIRVDRTGPAVVPNDPGEASGLVHDPDSDVSFAEWPTAIDPTLADGSEPAGTSEYHVRWRPSGSADWSAVLVAVETHLDLPTTADSVDLEVTSVDAAGNAGPPVTLVDSVPPVDPVPIPESTPSTDPPLGEPGEDDAEVDSGGDLNEEYYSTEARSKATHVHGSFHYTCKDTYGPVQAWPSGFVFGTCEPGTEVHAFDLANFPQNEPPPGRPSEGFQWAGVAFPSGSTFNGCGWMSTKKRLDHTGEDNTSKCAKVQYGLTSFVRPTSKAPAGTPAPKSKYKGLLIWSHTERDAHGKIVLGPDGKPSQKNGRDWTSKGDCQAYANINPWKSGQTARGAITEPDGTPYMVMKGDSLKIRYMAANSAINPETGHYIPWVMAYTGPDSYADWAWYSAPCLF